MKFKLGDHVSYKAKRLVGVIVEAFQSDEDPASYRYYVKTKQHTWSVNEQDLQMSKSQVFVSMKSST